MRKAVILPGAVLAAGIGGFFLRRWELAAAFEPDTGLPIPGAPATLSLIGLSALVAIALLLLCRGRHNTFEGGYDQAFGAKGNTLYITAMVLAAFLLLASGVLLLLGLPAGYRTALETQGMNPVLSTLPKILQAALTLGCFFCVLALGKNSYRGEGKGKYSFPLLMPAYMACMWLISAYQTRAGDPIRLNYIYELMAIITALLGFYFMAGFSFGRGKVFVTSLFSLLGVYFSVVTLADTHDLATMLLFGFSIFYLLAGVTALLDNDRERMCPSADQSNEITTEDATDE